MTYNYPFFSAFISWILFSKWSLAFPLFFFPSISLGYYYTWSLVFGSGNLWNRFGHDCLLQWPSLLPSRSLTSASGTTTSRASVAGWIWRSPSRSSWINTRWSPLSTLEWCFTCLPSPSCSRRSPGEKFPAAWVEKVVRWGRKSGAEVKGPQIKARDWLCPPARSFSHRIPREVLECGVSDWIMVHQAQRHRKGGLLTLAVSSLWWWTPTIFSLRSSLFCFWFLVIRKWERRDLECVNSVFSPQGTGGLS